VGPLSFGVQAVISTLATSGAVSPDGGSGANRVSFAVGFFDAPPVSCKTSPTPPFEGVVVRVANPDGGSVTTGTWLIDGVGTRVSRGDFLFAGQGPVGGEALSGSVEITRLDSSRSSGSFTSTMQQFDGGTSSLSGTWDALICP
jgi:hypothetical protein